MHTLPTLKPGDQVEIITPASRCSDLELSALIELLESWDLKCIHDNAMFGDDLLCANTDAYRLNALKNALLNPNNRAIICARGGYGCMRLIPELSQIAPPSEPKLFVGFSDITALHLFLGQQWQWPTIHASLSQSKSSPESIQAVKSILFHETPTVQFSGRPLNQHAEKDAILEAQLTGGNLCLVQTSLGTVWQIQAKQKFILLEEVGERGYRVDRMLEQLRQANVFEDAAAIIFGDFIEGNEPDGTSLLLPVLERFAQRCSIPVVKIQDIGHGYQNFPAVLGSKAQLTLGRNIQFNTTITDAR